MLAEVYVLNGRDAGKVLDSAAGPVIFLGRAASNTLRLRDPQMSRVHCRIEFTTEGLTLTDAESGNGTFLNGERLAAPQLLADGDEIEIGGTKLKVLIETDEDREDYQRRLGRADALEASASLEASSLQRSVNAEAERPGRKERAQTRRSGRPELQGQRLREVIPGFRLEARLGGKSRQGVAVYRAIQRSLDRPVALKVFLPRGQTLAEDVRRFVREAKAVARVPHPNVVTIHDVIAHGKLQAIVYEFVGGGSLSDQLESGPLDLPDALAMARSLAGALAHLHSHGVLHRGIKAEHLLYEPVFEIYKLSNFGTATGPGGQRSGETTYLNAPLAGLAFLSPEQLTGGEVTPASDIYSLAACVYAALAGRPLFSGSSVATLAASVLRDPPPPLPKSVPPALGALLRECLGKEPSERPADGASLAAALDALGG